MKLGIIEGERMLVNMLRLKYYNNNNNTIFLQGSSVSYNKAAIKRSPVLNKIVFALFAKNKN